MFNLKNYVIMSIIERHNKNYFCNHKKTPNMIHTCFYCNLKGNTTDGCYFKNFGIPNDNYVWVEKRTNPRRPKEN